jgi:hypothetical protein
MQSVANNITQMYSRRKSDIDSIKLEARARKLARELPDYKLQRQLDKIDEARRAGRTVRVTMLSKNVDEHFHRVSIYEEPKATGTQAPGQIGNDALVSAAIYSLVTGLIIGVSIGYAFANTLIGH